MVVGVNQQFGGSGEKVSQEFSMTTRGCLSKTVECDPICLTDFSFHQINTDYHLSLLDNFRQSRPRSAQFVN
jgi:hypothetical protein